MSQGRERRKTDRLESKFFLEIFKLPSKEKKGRGVVVDVSLTGMAIETEADLKPGDTLECHIEAPVRIKTKVVRHLIPGQVKTYGLKMVNLSLLDKLVIKKILKGSRLTRKI
ncbi:hypothetical protein BVX98_06450 [bacterium F11]|nr:hypothetical protein BVX98_06450 [bacterium F11]